MLYHSKREVRQKLASENSVMAVKTLTMFFLEGWVRFWNCRLEKH